MIIRGGLAGFLPWRGFLMIDVIVVGMAFFLLALCWSLFSVRARRAFGRHKRAQIVLSAGLLAAIVLFEVDIRFFDDWRARADASPYFDAATGRGAVIGSLLVHLAFAASTLGLWLLVLVRAVRRFPAPPRPGRHSRAHTFWGWVAAVDMVLTVLSGWVFYVLAFVA